MFKTLFISTALVGTFAQASHNINCKGTATVKSVEILERFNGSIIKSRNTDVVKNDYEQLVTIELTTAENITSSTPCYLEPKSTVTLLADKSKTGTLTVDQELNFEYQNLGDRAASKITWTLIEKLVD